MHWYFTKKCAGLFPFRHRFQTHYQFPKDDPITTIGEQPGPRPYSRGNGPIGAPGDGFTWAGDLSSFAEGVPAFSGSPPPLTCHGGLEIVGSALPPPNTWTELLFPIENGIGFTEAFLDDQFGVLSWQASGDGTSLGDYHLVRWFFDGGGMRLFVKFVTNEVPQEFFEGELLFDHLELDAGGGTWFYHRPFFAPYLLRELIGITCVSCIPS